tara:strand:- start:9097 stop:9582 length:486 start_codon:yes stop_codon:yes gene_type:complete
MAVPSSGILTMLGLAQERKFSTYGSGFLPSPILMTDLINGGGLNSFPALNASSPFKPNTTTPHAMSEWYGYDQDYVPAPICYDITLNYLSSYKFPQDSCFKGILTELQTTDPESWYTVPLSVKGSGCMEAAPSGAYSDRTNVWGVWDGKDWVDVGLCEKPF